MKRSKTIQYQYISCLLWAIVLLSGCSDCDVAQSTGVGTLSFEVRARKAEMLSVVPDDAWQYTRLYVAERLTEHDVDSLHCSPEKRYTLTGGTYRRENLYGQWYKFAFVCVPRWTGGGGEKLLTEEKPVERTCDFNKLLIDFNEAMKYQQTQINVADGLDMNLYRKVIDRWIDLDSSDPEDVEMARMTGELMIDMGIPTDQFPYPVKSITLTLEKTKARAYLHDQAEDEVIIAPEASPADRVYTLDFSSLNDKDYAQAIRQKQHFRLCLLPQALKGGITVTYKGTSGALYLPIGKDTENGETSVEVRKNQVTTVLYNGMQKDEFEVRYAGFDAGDDAEVDVDDDTWNGW